MHFVDCLMRLVGERRSDAQVAPPSPAVAAAIDPFYSGVIGTIDPISFLSLLDPNLESIGRAFRIDFDDVQGHDFVAAEEDLPSNYIAEREVSQFLGRLCAVLGARHVIEVGCYVGGSSAYIAKALANLAEVEPLPAPRLYCVDVNQRYLEKCQLNLRTLGLANIVSPILGKATDADVLEKLPRAADLIYIDSSHEFDETCREIEIYSRRLAKGGCLALHDAIQWPGVRKAVASMSSGFDVMTFATSRGNGVAVLFRKADWDR